MRQASSTAEVYFKDAITVIDNTFDKGYAQAHPELVAAFMNAAASDMNTATLREAQAAAIDRHADAIRELANNIDGLLTAQS